MEDLFDYDVFLSFVSTDEELVRPVWQELCLSGLRVFWSDAVLKQRLGDSWFDSIQSALERSRHFLLMVSRSSMSSEWVKREYQAFYNHCYRSGTRRLIPVLAGQYDISQLPLFLKQLQATQLSDADALRGIIRALGGTNLEELKQALLSKEDENKRLRQTVAELESTLSSKMRDLETVQKDKAALEAELTALKSTSGAAAGSGQSVPIVPREVAATPEAITLPESNLPAGPPRQIPVKADVEVAITDIQGNRIELVKPGISYAGGYGPSLERKVILVRRGVEESKVAWSSVDTITFRPRKEKNAKGTDVWRYDLVVRLRSGKQLGVEIVDDWNMAYGGGGGTGLLSGETDLGETKIRFCDIKNIQVLASPAE